MSKQDEYKIRALRFLSGNFIGDDLSALFLFLRTKPFGCDAVRDIGDMKGHADTRDRGISLDRIRDQFQMLRMVMWRTSQKDGSLDLSFAPCFLFDSMIATLSRIDELALRAETGLSRKRARRTVKSLRSKFHKVEVVVYDKNQPNHLFENGNITWVFSVSQGLSALEIQVIQSLTSTLIIKKPYTRRDLVEEFAKSLLKNDLINVSDIPFTLKCTSELAIFAVSAMHNLIYDLPDGFVAHALAGTEWTNDKLLITVKIGIKFPTELNKEGEIWFNIFDSELEQGDWISDELKSAFPCTWKFPLELNGAARLVEMKG